MSNQKRTVIYNVRFGAVCALFALLCVNKLPAAPQPLVFYDFEEGSGSTVINHGSMSGDGTIMNTADWISGTPGISDGGYRFNGLAGAANVNYIETGFTAGELGVYHATEIRPFTMACWLRGGKDSGFEIVFGQPLAGADKFLHLGLRDAEPHFGLHGDDLHVATLLQTGTWHHLTFVLSADNIQRVFIDGKFAQSRLATRTGIFNDAPIILGATRNDYDNSPDGAVDDVVIYNEELSFSQIQFLAEGGSPTNLPERIVSDDGWFTAPTGVNNTWNLYRVYGHTSGTPLTWWDAHLTATNMIVNGARGHLVSISSSRENELCRYLRNLSNGDCFIGLTDNDTNQWNTVLFPGAYESGTIADVPNIEDRRTNGWVWVTGEPFGGETYRNWRDTEPNDAGAGEDAVLILSGGFWNDSGSGIPGTGEAANLRNAIFEWDLNSPEPIENAVIASTIPDASLIPGSDLRVDGSFVGVWVRDAGEIDGIRTAASRLVSGKGTVIVTNQNIPMINFSDPDLAANVDDVLFPNNQPYFADIAGVAENHWVAYYRGRVVVPAGEGGLYTFGVHADDGFALRIAGHAWQSVHGKGYLDFASPDMDTIYAENSSDSDTRGIINLPSGVHEIELLTYNITSGQHHELYAAKGAFTNDADTTTWRLVGYKSVGELNFVSISPYWELWYADNIAPNNLASAWTQVSGYIGGGVNHSIWPEINFYDPENSPAGRHDKILPDSVPFPWNTEADDNYIAQFARTTLNVPQQMTLGLGFMADDGVSLTVSNQTWDAIVLAEKPAATSINGDTMTLTAAYAVTAGTLNLAAGSYPLSVLYHENSGAAYLDVFQYNMTAYNAQSLKSFVFRTLSADSAETITDIDGLQLFERKSMLMIIR